MIRWLGVTAAVGIIAGVLLFGFRAYGVAMAGGLQQPLTIPAVCNEAATGSDDTAYRPGQRITVDRHYLPPTASCVWSDGSTVDLIRPDAFSWGGPVLIIIGLLALVGWRIRSR